MGTLFIFCEGTSLIARRGRHQSCGQVGDAFVRILNKELALLLQGDHAELVKMKS